MPARSSWSAQTGVEVVSSGDLIQRFAAVWDGTQIATHRTASEKLYRVKDRAFDAIARAHCATASPTTEYDIQQLMAGWFRDEGLVTDSDPNVSAEENAGNPHYLPTAVGIPRHSPRRTGAARSLGQARSARRGVCRHHLDGLHRPHGARPVRQALCARSRPRATPRSRSSSAPSPADRSCAAGRSIARHRRCCASAGLRRPHPASHRPQPRRRRSTATASTWTTTKRTTIGGCSLAPASRSSRACTSTTSACGPKST